MEISSALDKLLLQLTRLRLPVAHQLQPGLTREEIDAVTSPLPFQLPAELYHLYMWHNGALPQSGLADGESMFLSDLGHLLPYSLYPFVPLEQALEYSQYFNEEDYLNNFWIDYEDEEVNFERRQDYLYFSLFSDPGDSDYIVLCTAAERQKAPVVYWSSEEGAPILIHRSLCDMIATMTACYESGAWYIGEDGDVKVNYKMERDINQRLNPDLPFHADER